MIIRGWFVGEFTLISTITQFSSPPEFDNLYFLSQSVIALNKRSHTCDGDSHGFISPQSALLSYAQFRLREYFIIIITELSEQSLQHSKNQEIGHIHFSKSENSEKGLVRDAPVSSRLFAPYYLLNFERREAPV